MYIRHGRRYIRDTKHVQVEPVKHVRHELKTIYI